MSLRRRLRLDRRLGGATFPKRGVILAKSSSRKTVRKTSTTSARKAGTDAKQPAKKTTKKAAKKAAPSKPAKKAAAPKAKSAAKSTAATTKAATTKKTAAQKPAPEAAAAKPAAAEKKSPKGITVVTPKPARKESSRGIKMPETEPLLKPGGKWKPLIPSGPSAAPPIDQNGNNDGDRKKQRLSKRELEKYRKILLAKREELLGDITNMEDEALRGSGSGSLSHTPQHMAEQGSDAYDQALSLDLAQVDRNLLKEIDEALKRIDDGTYGFCELSGRRIRSERLEELPWTRFSIEAARERERRSFR